MNEQFKRERETESGLIERLVAQCLENVEKSGESRVEEACRDHPELRTAVLRRVELLREIGLIGSSGALMGSPAGASHAPREFPEVLGDFRLVKKLGSGAMGVVYEARQESLGRVVALKLIRPEQLFFGGAHDRFHREVEAVARLSHPGIVPIHMVGREQGIPFFAMDLVAGRSLQQVLDSVFDGGGRPADSLAGVDLARALVPDGPANKTEKTIEELGSLLGPTWIQAAVRIAWQIAEALAHAHARGVIHRDVKPSNILIKPDGGAVLVDFGLAAMRGGDKLTRTGSALGSPHYMAPEVFTDGGANAGQASDVYSLGVTFYELLTLHQPFSGSTEELIVRILSGDCLPPRRQNHLVPWDVETVCLKAMERDVERRYATADAFARDLRNLLELRPIEAARPSLAHRVRRFAQRRPGSAMSLVLLFFIVVIFPLGYSIALRQKNLEIGKQRDLAEARRKDSEDQRAIAETHRNATLAVVDSLIEGFSAQAISDAPGTLPVRQKAFERASELVAELRGSESGQVDVMRRVLDIELRLSWMSDAIGDYDAALERASRVRAELDRFVREDPDDRGLALGLAKADRLCAAVLARAGRYDEAADRIREALPVLRRLRDGGAADATIDGEYFATLSLAISTLARVDTEATERVRSEAIEQFPLALERWPDDLEIRLLWLVLVSRFTWEAGEREDVAEVDRWSAETRAQLSRIKADGSAVSIALEVLTASVNLAEAAERIGRSEEVVASLESVIEEARRFAARFPERVAFQVVLARCLGQCAENRFGYVGSPKSENDAIEQRALDELEEAVQILRRLLDRAPGDRTLVADFYATAGSYADRLASVGRDSEAAPRYREALAAVRRDLEIYATDASANDNFLQSACGLGLALLDLGDPSAALEIAQEAESRLAAIRDRGVLTADEFAARELSARWVIAASLARLGRPREAFEKLLAASATPVNAITARAFAGVVSQCIEAERAAPGPDSEAVLATFASRGVAILDAMIEGGVDPDSIEHDATLSALLATDEGKAFLERVRPE